MILKRGALAFASLTLAAAIGAVTVLGSAGCGGSSSSTSGGNDPCYDYSAFTPTAAHFGADVLPIFQRSCGISTSCHQTQNNTNKNQPYLGPAKDNVATAAEKKAIIAGIVGVKSVGEPEMNNVTAGDPDASFLMHKLDGVECTKLACAAKKTCGTLMPQGSSTPMDAAERDTIRSWIKNGAAND
jgi:hypothetical protein